MCHTIDTIEAMDSQKKTSMAIDIDDIDSDHANTGTESVRHQDYHLLLQTTSTRMDFGLSFKQNLRTK